MILSEETKNLSINITAIKYTFSAADSSQRTRGTRMWHSMALSITLSVFDCLPQNVNPTQAFWKYVKHVKSKRKVKEGPATPAKYFLECLCGWNLSARRLTTPTSGSHPVPPLTITKPDVESKLDMLRQFTWLNWLDLIASRRAFSNCPNHLVFYFPQIPDSG